MTTPVQTVGGSSLGRRKKTRTHSRSGRAPRSHKRIRIAHAPRYGAGRSDSFRPLSRTFDTMEPTSTVPQTRLSEDISQLSPNTKTCPCGTVYGPK